MRQPNNKYVYRKPPARTSAQAVAIGVWLVACAAGFMPLLSYDFQPGRQAQPKFSCWPASSLLRTFPGKYTLVTFLHPQCSCSRATVGELAECMTHYGNTVTAYAVFLKPDGTDETWANSDLLVRARSIPGLHAVIDRNGDEAHRFGSSTSGQVLLFDPANHLVFKGGITESRGHYGDNAGLDLLIAHLRGEATSKNESPVFGCSLFDLNREKSK